MFNTSCEALMQTLIHRDTKAWQVQVWVSFMAAAFLCGVGLIARITYCSHTGMLSIGVLLPDSNCVTIRTGIAKRPNWPIVVASVPSSMPSAATTSA